MNTSTTFYGAAKSCFPHTEIIADKFHVVRQVTWAFERVRKREQKRFHPARRRYFKRSRRLLLKRPKMRKPYEAEQISHMPELSPDLAHAYLLKIEYQM